VLPRHSPSICGEPGLPPCLPRNLIIQLSVETTRKLCKFPRHFCTLDALIYFRFARFACCYKKPTQKSKFWPQHYCKHSKSGVATQKSQKIVFISARHPRPSLRLFLTRGVWCFSCPCVFCCCFGFGEFDSTTVFFYKKIGLFNSQAR